MDADFIERRDRDLSDRFSMDPQRFEEILAALRVGLGNIRSCFEDVKIADILEEVSTDFAHQALESDSPPNFAEAAVVLQHCATLYGRKVDYLYQNVIDVSEALASAPDAEAGAGGAAEVGATGAAATPGGKRRRRASCPLEFAHVPVSECGAATRAPEPPKPPPTLSRMYIELEPRVLTAHDAQLCDYNHEPVGLPADFHVAWRLQDGLLTDELSERGCAGSGALRPLSLVELQAALAAAAPGEPPRAWSPPPSPDTPALSPPLAASTPMVPDAASAALLKRRKRRRTDRLEDIVHGSLRLSITPEMRAWIRRASEFACAAEWRARVVAQRSRHLLDSRASLTIDKGFRGFEDELAGDAGGFLGWSAAEALAAEERAARLLPVLAALGSSLCAGDPDSDDDGFFERSSFSSSDAGSFTSASQVSPAGVQSEESLAAAAAWSARVVECAAAQEARGGVDVRALGAALLRALPPLDARHVLSVLGGLVAEPHDVSRYLLTALFLANSENVQIVRGAAGSVNSFSLRLLSADESALAAAAEAALAPPARPTLPARPAALA